MNCDDISDDTGDWLDGRPLLRLALALAIVAAAVVLSDFFPLPWWGPR